MSDDPAIANTTTTTPTATEWNPRYAAFARVHGHTPEEQHASDDTLWPGARMVGFMLWISAQWGAWRGAANAADGGRRTWNDPLRPENHVAFDARLAELGHCSGCIGCAGPLDEDQESAPKMSRPSRNVTATQ